MNLYFILKILWTSLESIISCGILFASNCYFMHGGTVCFNTLNSNICRGIHLSNFFCVLFECNACFQNAEYSILTRNVAWMHAHCHLYPRILLRQRTDSTGIMWLLSCSSLLIWVQNVFAIFVLWRIEAWSEHLSHVKASSHSGVAGDIQQRWIALHGLWIVSDQFSLHVQSFKQLMLFNRC